MAEPNPDNWAQSHIWWLALSRRGNEGGASPSRPTAGPTGPAVPAVHMAQTKGLGLLLRGFAASVSQIRQIPG